MPFALFFLLSSLSSAAVSVCASLKEAATGDREARRRKPPLKLRLLRRKKRSERHLKASGQDHDVEAESRLSGNGRQGAQAFAEIEK